MTPTCHHHDSVDMAFVVVCLWLGWTLHLHLLPFLLRQIQREGSGREGGGGGEGPGGLGCYLWLCLPMAAQFPQAWYGVLSSCLCLVWDPCLACGPFLQCPSVFLDGLALSCPSILFSCSPPHSLAVPVPPCYLCLHATLSPDM